MSTITASVGGVTTSATSRELANRALGVMKLAAMKAAAHQATPGTVALSDDPSSFERIFYGRLRTRRADQQHAAFAEYERFVTERAARALGATSVLDSVDFKSKDAVEVQALRLFAPTTPPAQPANGAAGVDVRSLPRLRDPRELILNLPQPPWEVQIPPLHLLNPVTTLDLRIHRVVCVDETGGWLVEHAGRDDMYLAGSTIDPGGSATEIAAYHVGEFNDGTVVNYPQPRVFGSIPLNAAGVSGWPRSYGIVFALAEVDEGGFSDFVHSLVRELEAYLKQEIEKAVVALGNAVGLGPVVSQILAEAVGWVVDQVFGWLESAWKDDIFTPVSVTATLASIVDHADWRTASPVAIATFKGHNGTYTIDYDWHLH